MHINMVNLDALPFLAHGEIIINKKPKLLFRTRTIFKLDYFNLFHALIISSRLYSLKFNQFSYICCFPGTIHHSLDILSVKYFVSHLNF